MKTKSILKNILPDKIFLTYKYQMVMGKKLNLKNPQTFNEKLQWLKLHDRQPKYTLMVDKYKVKKYVADLIGEKYVIPTLGVWEHFEEIDFSSLPNQFVLKCTHDSGGVVICKDKSLLDINQVQFKIESCLNQNFYYIGREWPYKNVKKKIIAEEYMVDESGYELKDYKLLCFHGQVKCSYVGSNRENNLLMNFYDRDWKPMPFERHYPKNPKEIDKPICYLEMVELAEKLSKDIPFVRVDFYQVNNRPYFGEITFYPGSGMEEFTPEEWDYILGSWIVLPDNYALIQ